jgi:hypothetical protein
MAEGEQIKRDEDGVVVGALHIQAVYPVWRMLEMPAEQIKYEIERMAHELGYAGMKSPGKTYEQAQLWISFRMEQLMSLDGDHANDR